MAVFPQIGLVLLAVRFLAGIGHGLVFIAAVLHGAENSLNSMRPQVVSMLQTGLICAYLIYPMLISTAYMDNSELLMDVNQLVGIFNLVCSALAIIFTFIFTYESVVVDAAKGQDETA